MQCPKEGGRDYELATRTQRLLLLLRRRLTRFHAFFCPAKRLSRERGQYARVT
jgi:hypothetical protein